MAKLKSKKSVLSRKKAARRAAQRAFDASPEKLGKVASNAAKKRAKKAPNLKSISKAARKRKKPDLKTRVYKDTCELFSNAYLTTEEILKVYGNLGIALGVSIDEIDISKKPLNIEEIRVAYLKEPTVGSALVLQGYLITTWSDNIKEEGE